MINCICVDKDKKSREAIERMLRKIGGVQLRRSYATLAAAVKACLENRIDILFVSLYDCPVPKKDTDALKKVMKHGTKIILMSSKIGVVSDAIAINASDYVLFPTSSRRLWKASKKALNIKDFGIEMPKMRIGQPEDSRITLNF